MRKRCINLEDPGIVAAIAAGVVSLAVSGISVPDLDRELAFFSKHRHCMRCRDLGQRGFAISLGVIEAASKAIVTQRLKCSGMRRRILGGQAVLTGYVGEIRQ